MSMSESVTEFSEVFLPYFPPPTSSSVRVMGLVVVVGSCGSTDSGTYKLLLHPFCLPQFSNVVNECCMKSLWPAFCWKWTCPSVLRATTTTTTTTSTSGLWHQLIIATEVSQCDIPISIGHSQPYELFCQ